MAKMAKMANPRENEHRIGILDLGGGEYVRISATSSIDVDEALDWAEEIIAVQRRVLAKRAKRSKIDDNP
jgi:hypothetical protein